MECGLRGLLMEEIVYYWNRLIKGRFQGVNLPWMDLSSGNSATYDLLH